jgi:hypothetical protein
MTAELEVVIATIRRWEREAARANEQIATLTCERDRAHQKAEDARREAAAMAAQRDQARHERDDMTAKYHSRQVTP